ncbi:MAG TPA: aldose epimerase family protein [Mucilaginibacter sp.]|nr:aldose epimerase family protein [Mucilaginibacter sp.]
MNKSATEISYQSWGEYAGQPVFLFKMKNGSGAYVELTNYGATLVAAIVPDVHGVYGNAVLGYTSLQAYVDDNCYLGATIGRYANRIAGAKFKIDDITYRLENNDGKNTNHGGHNGFNSKVFKYTITADGLSFSIQSKNGDGGYPGDLDLTVNYRWTDLNELIISYHAVADKKTVANFTNHAYFNLSNDGSKIFDHSLKVYADNVLENDDEYIPTGRIKPTGEIAFTGTSIRNKMVINEDMITGINDCYLLNEQSNISYKRAAELFEKRSGRKLEVFTSYPAIMVYTADYLQSNYPGHHLHRYSSFDGLCLECQYYPDSPNHANFPTTVLEKGDIYQETIIYKFSTVA